MEREEIDLTIKNLDRFFDQESVKMADDLADIADSILPILSKGPWQLPASCIISDEGRKLVARDPDLGKQTLEQLVITEKDLFDPKARSFIATHTPREIIDEVFDSNGGIGRTHLALCIRAAKQQYIADVVARFADDKKISFIEAAFYVKALHVCNDFWFVIQQGYKLKKYFWKPEPAIPTEEMSPAPVKPKKKKPSGAKATFKLSKDLPECPVCSSKAIMLRGGERGMQWQACCTDPEQKCENYLLKETWYPSEKAAVSAWKKIVKSCAARNETSRS
ncbi:MAG: hypothetical protein IJJ43_06340 [Oscillospiraceae bacterium]|nr:hypothetical protein [Oscillospiraceae bacterium]MBQ6465867.1 hypothetical protein [Oscillospiraceae bacterium]